MNRRKGDLDVEAEGQLLIDGLWLLSIRMKTEEEEFVQKNYF
jgi:hypothetical protein